jgi:retron-type reverse transcriptase
MSPDWKTDWSIFMVGCTGERSGRQRKVNYVLDADIRGFFDNLDKSWLVKFVEQVADPRILG